MLYCCDCGLEYLVTPKEIPCNDNAGVICPCGRPVKGRWGAQFFDYEANHISRTEDDRIASGSDRSGRLPSATAPKAPGCSNAMSKKSRFWKCTVKFLSWDFQAPARRP